MFALDSGGAGPQNVGKPFLYQGRDLYGIGSMPILIAYQKAKRPNIRKVGFFSGIVTGLFKDFNTLMVDALKKAGYDVSPQVYAPATTVDFSQYLTTLQRGNPDIIIMPTTFGTLDAVVLKQAQGLAVTQPIVSVDYDRAWATQAPASAIKKYEFGFDYFDSNNPPTQWGKLFVSEYRRVYGQYPDYYAANYYESAFLVYELVRRIIANGQDPSKQGDAYVNAFAQSPSFPSVYSATPGAPFGTSTFSPTGHQVINRPVAYGHGNPDGSGTVLANAIQTGAGFQLTAAGQAAA
jgi:hypothetical protein